MAQRLDIESSCPKHQEEYTGGIADPGDYYPPEKTNYTKGKACSSWQPNPSITGSRYNQLPPPQRQSCQGEVRAFEDARLRHSDILYPGMIERQHSQVVSATPEIIEKGYVYSKKKIDTDTPKNALIMGCSDLFVKCRCDFPAERRRFFPSDIVYNGCFFKPDVTIDDLIDIPSKINKYTGCYYYNDLLNLANSNYMHVRLAAREDSLSTDDEGALAKGRQILIQRGITKDNIYTADPEKLIPEGSRFRIGMYACRPFKHLTIIHDGAGQSYARYDLPNDCLTYIPVRSVTCSTTSYIQQSALPYPKYHLVGLEKLERMDADTVLLTSNPEEVFLNKDNPKFIVLSWVGGLDTLNAVCLTPLYGKTVVYVHNPSTYGGDKDKCLKVFEELRSLLGENSNVNLLDREGLSGITKECHNR